MSNWGIAEDLMIQDYEVETPLYHYHHCPECFEHHDCSMNCTIEPDLGTHNGRPFGSHCKCAKCDKAAAPALNNNSKYIKIYSKQWWDIYNGFAAPKPYVDELGNIKNWYSME